MILGSIHIKDFLEKTKGGVYGTIFSDAKDRYYTASYEWGTTPDDHLIVSRKGSTNTVKLTSIRAR